LPASRRSSRLVRRGTRPRTTWATSFTNAISLTAANQYTTLDLLAEYEGKAGAVTVGISILRTIWLLTVLGTPATGDQFTYGVIRGQSSDIGANIAGAPVPTDHYEDWAYLSQETAGGNTAAVFSHFGASNILAYDLKVGRKLPELDMRWNFVIEAGPHTTFPATFNLAARTLIRLP
jgi:hypothetical protein